MRTRTSRKQQQQQDQHHLHWARPLLLHVATLAWEQQLQQQQQQQQQEEMVAATAFTARGSICSSSMLKWRSTA